jgi:cytoskeletal protein CcmA (bactofilin family)
MFTRRGDARAARSVSNLQLTEAQIEQARAAAAPAQFVPLNDPVQLTPPHSMSVASAAPPPPLPAAPGLPSASPPAATPPVPHRANQSVIGEDLTIEGQSITIRCKGALEINGRIQAELHSQRLVVGMSGQVEGTIAADSVDVLGRVSGTIMGARVVLHSSAEVEGDIHAKTLTVADGASFEGRSRKVTDPATIAPRLDPSDPAPTAGNTVPMPKPVPMAVASVPV